MGYHSRMDYKYIDYRMYLEHVNGLLFFIKFSVLKADYIFIIFQTEFLLYLQYIR